MVVDTLAAPQVTLGAAGVVYELENGDRSTGVSTATTPITGFSGTGYVTGFASAGQSVTIEVDSPVTAIYDLTISSALYMQDVARGKPHTYSHSTSARAGNSITGGVWTNAAYWASDVPTYVGQPRWVQVDLGAPMLIEMARIRMPVSWGSRTLTFSLLGGTDEYDLIELAPSRTYTFTQATGNTGAGNYVDVMFAAPATIRYARVVCTGRSDNGTDGYQISNFELYPPHRTAELRVDGSRVGEFAMTPQKIINPSDIASSGAATFNPGVPVWREDSIGSVLLTAGTHTISIVSGGSFPNVYNLDKITFSAPEALGDQAVVNAITAVNALPAPSAVTLGDKPAIAAARSLFDGLSLTQQDIVFNISELDAAEERIFYLETYNQDVADVIAMINGLPVLSMVKLSGMDQIDEARDAYELLSASQQSLVTNYNRLLAVEDRLSKTGYSVAINNLVCHDTANAAGWSVETGLAYTDPAWSDRMLYFSHIPAFLVGCDWVRPHMNSNAYDGGVLVEFDVAFATNLYVGWDTRAAENAWLAQQGFVKTDLVVTPSNGVEMTLYKKTVATGEHISLGSVNQASVGSYLIFLERFTEFDPTINPDNDPANRPPIIGNLVVNDAANSQFWAVQENFQVGDIAYGDSTAVFTAIPDELSGSSWISPTSASAAWSGGSELCSFTVNRDGYLYLAVAGAAPAWLGSDYSLLDSNLIVDSVPYRVYKKYVGAGTDISLPQMNNGSPLYIPFVKTMTISSSPDRPSSSRFVPPFDVNGWFSMRENFDVGTVLYSNAAIEVTEVPDKYKGCEYIQTYNATGSGDRYSVFFYAERDIEVIVTLDSRRTAPSWLAAWENTGEVIRATSSRTYNLYRNEYRADTFVQIPSLATSGTSDNYIAIIKPIVGTELTTNNPEIPSGVDKWDPDLGYKYYANDVFNLDSLLPADYTVTSGSAAIASDGTGKPVDLAFRRRYTSSITSEQFMNATDGNASTWAPSGANQWIAVSLGRVKEISSVEVWTSSARSMTFAVETSSDGVNYTERVASASYNFAAASGNMVSIPIGPGVMASHVRLTFSTTNTIVLHFKVFGSELSGVDKYVKLDGGSTGASLEKGFSGAITDRTIFEFKAKPSDEDKLSAITLADSSGISALPVEFKPDGFLYACDGGTQVQLIPYSSDTWYTFKLVTDLSKGTYDIWVNSLRRASGLSMLKAGAVGKIVFTAQSSAGILIDNVKAYDDTEIFLMKENFRSASLSDMALSGGWSFTRPNGADIADVPFASDRSLKLTANGSGMKATRTLPETEGVLTFETKVKPTSKGFAVLPMLTDDKGNVAAAVAFYRNNVYAASGDNWIKLMDGESYWSYYPADNWYNVKLTLNTYTKRYDLYIDGAFRMKGLSFVQGVESVSRVSYTLPDNNTCYVNNLNMYQGYDHGGVIDRDRVIDVKLAPYNAKGDGVTDDSEAIQAALDDAEYTGKTVLVRDGVFMTSTLTVRSDTTLYVDNTATIKGFQEKNHYPLVEPCDGRCNHYQVGRGLIYTQNASNVRIEGGGFLDGNGFYGYKMNDPATNRRLQDVRACVILSTLSNDITIQNIKLVRSAFWSLVVMESENVSIRYVDINSINNTPNRDGLNPVDVINCTIENCNILGGDDALCIKSSSTHGNRNYEIRNIMMMSLSNGFKFGTDSYWELRNLVAEDFTIKKITKGALCLEATDGAEIENLSFERIDMNDADAPIYMTVGSRRRVPHANSQGPRDGFINNVQFKDVNFFNYAEVPYSYEANTHENVIIGLNNGANRIQNVSFENVVMEMPGGRMTVPNPPSGTGSSYPEHYTIGGIPNAWAWCIRYADNITFTNCVNILLQDDARPEYAFTDYRSAEEMKILVLTTEHSGGKAVARVQNVARDDTQVMLMAAIYGRANGKLVYTEMDDTFISTSKSTITKTFDFNVSQYPYTDYKIVVFAWEKDTYIPLTPPSELLPAIVSITTNGSVTTGEEVRNLIDNNTGTKWYTAGALPLNVYIEFSEPVTIDSFRIATANDANARDPRMFTVGGNNVSGGASATYNTFYTHDGTNLPTDRYAITMFHLSQPVTYKYFRLQITERRSGTAGMQMSEFNLIGDFNRDLY